MPAPNPYDPLYWGRCHAAPTIEGGGVIAYLMPGNATIIEVDHSAIGAVALDVLPIFTPVEGVSFTPELSGWTPTKFRVAVLNSSYAGDPGYTGRITYAWRRTSPVLHAAAEPPHPDTDGGPT